MTKFHVIIKSLASIAFACSSVLPAFSQEFPADRPIHLVVGYVPGGATDTVARIVAEQLSKNLGQNVIVENRPGAGGVIGDQYVANSKPDGATILLSTMGSLTVAPLLMKLKYDPAKDLTPLTMAVKFPMVLIVPSSLKINTLKEFIDLAKERGGQLNFGSPGIGSASHLAGEMFNHQTGVEIVHVPYKGGSAVMVDLLSQRLAAYFASPTSAEAHLKAGRIVALATTGSNRSGFLPNVPTVAESGYPEFNAENWYALSAPGSTPIPILDRWNKELVKVLNTAEVKQKLLQQGLPTEPGTREDVRRYMETESTRWAKVIKARHITLD